MKLEHATSSKPPIEAPRRPMGRRLALAAVVVALAMGLLLAGSLGTSRADAQSAAQPAAAAAVNGEVIAMDELNEMMLRAWGFDAVNQLIGNALVVQAATAAGVSVTEADVADEQRKTLQAMLPQVEGAEPEALLDEILRSRNVPRHIWDVTMRRNALLRKLALKRIMITDEMLTDAFNSRYGLKVQIRHIQTATLADAQRIYELLQQDGDFAELATQYSINADTAPAGGLIAPFSRDDRDIPVVIRQSAFALADGKISEILQDDRFYHILRRERTIAPETGVKFEDVHEQLKAELIEQRVRNIQPRLVAELRAEADIVLLDPVLKQEAARREAAPVGQ